MAKDGPSVADLEAVVEQAKRGTEEALLRNGFFESVLSSSVSRARTAPSWMHDGANSEEGVASRAAVHEIASGIDAAYLRNLVSRASDVFADSPPTRHAVTLAAKQCFPTDKRVVVTLLPERSWAEIARTALVAAAALSAVAAVAVAARRRGR